MSTKSIKNIQKRFINQGFVFTDQNVDLCKTKSMNRAIIVNINICLFDLLKCAIWFRSFEQHFIQSLGYGFYLAFNKNWVTYWFTNEMVCNICIADQRNKMRVLSIAISFKSNKIYLLKLHQTIQNTQTRTYISN